MTLKETYAGQPYEIRLKAPVLQATTFVLCLAAFLTGTLNVFTPARLPSGILLLILGVLEGVAFLWVRKGLYSRSAPLAMLTIAVGLSLNQWIQGWQGYHTLYNNLGVNFMIIFATLAMMTNGRLILGVILGVNVSLFSQTLVFALGGQLEPPPTIPLLTALVMVLLVHLIGSSLAVFIHRIFSKVLKDSLDQLEKITQKEKKLLDITLAVGAQLRETKGLQTVIDETAAGALEIERNVQSINGLVGNLNGEFTKAQGALTSMEGRITYLSQQSEDQSSNITETSAAVEEMVASIGSVNKVIETRKSVVEDLGRRAASGQEILEETATSFAQVLERIDAIREMTDFISGVAGQTNLLAMNAAIEAAHAGEAGKGFAVVADEVRKLAESSSQNAKQIGTILAELLRAISTTGDNVTRTGQSFSAIQTGIKDVNRAMDEISSSVHELALGSGEILKATGSMNQITQQVFTGIQDLARETEGVQTGIGSMGGVLSQTVMGMTEIAQGTAEIRDAMLSVQDLAQQLGRQAETLENSGKDGI